MVVALNDRLRSTFPLIIMIVGFSLLCCVALACFFPRSMMFGVTSEDTYRFFNLSFGIASSVFAFIYGVVVYRFANMLQIGGLCGYIMLGIGLILMTYAQGETATVSAAGTLSGAGLACAMVYWFVTLTYLHGTKAMLILGCQALFGGLVFASLTLLTPEIAHILVFVCMVVSCPFAIITRFRTQKIDVADDHAQGDNWKNLSDVLRSILLAAFGFVAVAFLYGALTPVAATALEFPYTSPAVILGTPIGAAAFLLWVKFSGGKAGSVFIQAVFAILALVLLLAPFDVTLAVFDTGYQVCGLLFYSMIINKLSDQHRLAALFIASGYALVHCAYLLGLYVPGRFGVSSYETFTQSAPFVIFVAYVLVAVLLFVMYRDKLREKQRYLNELGRQREEQEGLRRAVADSFDEEYDSICKQLGQDAGLTKREIEVLSYLARGRDVAFISNELYLSRNTVKGYTKRIYAKLSVHSKQELIDLVEQKHKER